MSVFKSFTIDQDTTFSFIADYQDSLNQPIDLTGYSAKLQVRDSSLSTKLAFSLTSATSGGIVIEGAIGRLTVTMSPAQTKLLFFPKSIYDLIITDPSGNKTKLLGGFLTLERTVTV